MIRMRRLLAGVLATSLLALAGCGGDDDEPSAAPTAVVTPGVQGDGSYQLGTLPDAAAAAALKAAVETLPVAVSYDYRSLDDSLTKATASMTPRFAGEFRTIFDGTTRTKAVAEQAITSALVRGAGVIGTVEGDRITCLVYLDQVLVASRSKKENSPLKVNQNSVRVKMQRVDGTWKVDGIEPF